MNNAIYWLISSPASCYYYYHHHPRHHHHRHNIIDVFQANINSKKKILMQQKCDGQHIINKLNYIQLNYNT